MDAAELFLRDHARTHGNGVGEPEGGMWLADFAVNGLTEEQMRRRPAEGMNSLVWILWHMARSEDMGVNALVAGRPQVIEEAGWLDRLGLSRADIGTGMTDDEVADFSGQVDIATMQAYRSAVGLRTREVVSALRPDEWAELQDADAMERAMAAGAIGPNAQWLTGLFGGKSKALILGHVGTGHNFWHLGEAVTVRTLLGQKLPI